MSEISNFFLPLLKKKKIENIYGSFLGFFVALFFYFISRFVEFGVDKISDIFSLKPIILLWVLGFLSLCFSKMLYKLAFAIYLEGFGRYVIQFNLQLACLILGFIFGFALIEVSNALLWISLIYAFVFYIFALFLYGLAEPEGFIDNFFK